MQDLPTLNNAPQQYIQYINNTYNRIDPKLGKVKVNLYQHQKYLIKYILTQNCLIMQSRQLGISSMYAWLYSSIAKLQPNTSILIVTNNIDQSQRIIDLIRLNINRNEIKGNTKTSIVLYNNSVIWSRSYSQLDENSFSNSNYILLDVIQIKQLQQIFKKLTINKDTKLSITFNGIKD